jgi:hypothetical protein
LFMEQSLPDRGRDCFFVLHRMTPHIFLQGCG